tara:strand:+ start:170 stop:643 length:474 start_codon:yes stop_codon:yes gene_type:complete
MKITKTQLKQIIKEELEATLRNNRINEFMGLGGKSQQRKHGKRQVTAQLGHIARVAMKRGAPNPHGGDRKTLETMLDIHKNGLNANTPGVGPDYPADQEEPPGGYPGIEDAVAAWDDAVAAMEAGDTSQMEELAQLEDDPRVPIFDWGSRGLFKRRG